jgi:hypothetical protein
MKIGVTVADLDGVYAAMQAAEANTRRATIAGVHDTTLAAKQALRNMTAAALKGRKLQNSWQSKDYTNSGYDAAGFIYSKAPQIMKAFSEGAVIRAHGHRFLAIKTENCPTKGTDGRAIRLDGMGGSNHGNWPEDRYGPLRLVKRPGRVWLLVVDGVRIGKSGRVKRLTTRKATKTMGERVNLGGSATVVMFVLVPQVTLKKLIDPNAVVKREAAKAPENILRNLKGV